MSKIRNILIALAGVFGAGLMIAGIVCGRWQSAPVCSAVDYTIRHETETPFVSESELTELLRAHNQYPVGWTLDKVSLQAIEDLIGGHPMVRSAECYTTPQGVLRVDVTQRVPLLRVTTATESYYIDTDRRRMPVRETVRVEVLDATGSIGPQLASGSLSDFAEWLAGDSYWRGRIREIQVRNPRQISLLQRDGAETILLGDMNDYAKKLHKLRVYYERGGAEIGAGKYREIDVRFEGQVVGRK